MNKPITLIIEETKQSLINVINEAKLAPFIMQPILRDLYEETCEVAKQQYTHDKEEYEKSLTENDNAENENPDVDIVE